MTNIKGMETYVAPVKTTPAQKDSAVKPDKNSESFDNQLNNAVNSSTGKDKDKDLPGKKPVKAQDTEENVKQTTKETKGLENLPIEGLPLLDITVPILTDDSDAADILRGITERTAAVVFSENGKPVLASEVSAQQTTHLITGEEVQNVSAKTDAAVKNLSGQRDAVVTKTDTSGFGMQQVDDRQSGKQQIQEEQIQTEKSQVQQSDTKQIQNSDTKQSGLQNTQQTQQQSPTGNANSMVEKPAELPQNQPQVQQQHPDTPQDNGMVKSHMDNITVTSQSEQPDDTKKTGEPIESFQDVSAIKQNRLEPETIVKIKVAEPYRTLDTDAVKQLAAKISEGAAKGNKELIIQLTPENLGKISIKISTEKEGVRVILSCENQKTLGLLSDKTTGISNIVENNLNQHTVVEIKEDGYWNQQKNATDQHSGQNGRQQEEQNNNNGQQDDTDNFIQQLRLGMHAGELAV